MKRSLVALWFAIFAAVVTIALLAQFWIWQRTRTANQRVSEMLANQLVPFDQAIKRVIEGYALEFQRASSSTDISNPVECVELRRKPLIRTLVVVDRQEQTLVYPTDLRNASPEERSLVTEAQQILRDRYPKTPASGQLLVTPAQTISKPTQLSNSGDNGSLGGTLSANSNWVTWYHRRGLIIGHAWQQESRWQAVIVLPSARWLADIVAALPDASSEPLRLNSMSNTTGESTLQQLVDVEGKVIHQWSQLPLNEWAALVSKTADAEMRVSTPLDGWRLREYATSSYRESLAGDNMQFPIWLAVAGTSLALILTGVLVTINIRRELRLALQRVSFVNQVSHELRTPLTNICMYADLIAQDLDNDSDSPEQTQQQERLSVIRGESRRLTRLINNVLEFARPTPLKELQRHPADLDLIVAETLATFEPKLKELGFRVELELNASGLRLLDCDAVEQMLVNLIGNAEKYAVAGKFLRVVTKTRESQVQICVIDQGPGVPSRLREQIFKPFVRLADRLEDPTGTGIGLTIARELARRHRGDCVLLDSDHGAAFQLTLDAPRCN